MTTVMPSDVGATGREQLCVRSRLADLALVARWVARLASAYSIPESVHFAMDLCLEEVLSNIIRHGYGEESDRPIIVRYSSFKNSFVLTVDDEAPPFNPLTWQDTHVEETLSGSRSGGFGLRLMQGFAGAIEYERTPAGNRLMLTFPERA